MISVIRQASNLPRIGILFGNFRSLFNSSSLALHWKKDHLNVSETTPESGCQKVYRPRLFFYSSRFHCYFCRGSLKRRSTSPAFKLFNRPHYPPCRGSLSVNLCVCEILEKRPSRFGALCLSITRDLFTRTSPCPDHCHTAHRFLLGECSKT